MLLNEVFAVRLDDREAFDRPAEWLPTRGRGIRAEDHRRGQALVSVLKEAEDAHEVWAYPREAKAGLDVSRGNEDLQTEVGYSKIVEMTQEQLLDAAKSNLRF